MEVPCGSRWEYIIFTMLYPFVSPFPLQLHTTLYLQLRETCNDCICSETAGLKNLGNEEPTNRLPGSLLFNGVIGNVWITAECLPCAEACRHQRATQILQAVSFQKACVWGGHVAVPHVYPVYMYFPEVSFLQAPVFTRMEMLQCKESNAISLCSNWEDIYVCANTARAFRMIWS